MQNINRQSDAEVHCTFVTVDGVETQVRHNCGVRTRGAGSRGANPSNYRLNIPNDNPWKDLDAINLNTQFTHAQAVGSVVAQRSGMTAADARFVQVRVNGINLAKLVVTLIQWALVIAGMSSIGYGLMKWKKKGQENDNDFYFIVRAE